MAFSRRSCQDPTGSSSPTPTTAQAVVLVSLLRLCSILLGLWLALAPDAGWTAAQQLQPIPPLTAHVVDRTATLSADQHTRMKNRLAAFEREKGTQVAVLIVPSTRPETIEAFALRVAESWKLGRKGVDDGVLLLIAKSDRELRIEVGYGLEGALNDATAKRIIEEIIIPKFRAGDFYGGINTGISAMFKVIGGEMLPSPESTSLQASHVFDNEIFDQILQIAIIFSLFFNTVFRAIFGRFIAAILMGGAVGLITFLLFSSLFTSIVAVALAFIFSLFASAGGNRISGGLSRSGDGGSSWSSNSSGDRGFSGGGGSFGGGGASGKW